MQIKASKFVARSSALKFRSFSRTSLISRNGESFANSASAGYMETMYNAWSKDPKSVHISWQAYFGNLKAGAKLPFQAPPTLIPALPVDGLPAVESADSSFLPSGEILDTMKVQLIVRAFQVRGHQQANLDPLGINFMVLNHNQKLLTIFRGKRELQS